ncbi:hypothetical protein [Lysinibacillus sp. C5.1]|uniref:hypothetical protein n=1 Tax=Lysinibacillus sp. C5.1 TaxID=2796169 RepID=UPI00308151B7
MISHEWVEDGIYTCIDSATKASANNEETDLSATKKKRTAKFYGRSNTIIAIDTDELDSNKIFDISNGIDPQTGKRLKIQHLAMKRKMLRFSYKVKYIKVPILFIKREGAIKL